MTTKKAKKKARRRYTGRLLRRAVTAKKWNQAAFVRAMMVAAAADESGLRPSREQCDSLLKEGGNPTIAYVELAARVTGVDINELLERY